MDNQSPQTQINPNYLELKLKEYSTEELCLFLREEKRRLSTQSLYFFTKYILGYKDMTESAHLPMCNFLENTQSKQKKILLGPKTSFKSTLSTIALPLRILACKMEDCQPVLIGSETISRASSFLDEIKQHIIGNTGFLDIFGIEFAQGMDRWNAFELSLPVRGRVFREPNISCSGIDTPRTSMHFRTIILDDLHSERNVTTKEQIEKVFSHIRLSLSLLEPGGILYIIGHRWHFTDAYSEVLDRMKNEFDAMILTPYLPDGSLWFPEKLNKEYLEVQKSLIGSYLFSCLYMNNPQSELTMIFRPELRKYYEEVPKDKAVRRYLLIDPALGDKQTDDEAAFISVAITSDNEIYIEGDEGHRGLTTDGYRETVERICNATGARNIGIEDVAFQRVLRWALEKMPGYRFFPLKPDHSKKDRVRGLQPYYEKGKIFFKKDHVDLTDQMNRFTMNSIYPDDRLDALAYVLQLIDPKVSRPSVRSEMAALKPIYRELGIPDPWERFRQDIAQDEQAKVTGYYGN